MKRKDDGRSVKACDTRDDTVRRGKKDGCEEGGDLAGSGGKR